MGSVWKCLGSILATCVFYLFCMELCESKQSGDDGSCGTTALAAGHWLGCCCCWASQLAARPSCGGPRLVPNRHLRSFPMRVSAHRYTHSSRRVFTTTCWFLLICFLSGRGEGRVPVGLCWTGEAAEGGLKHSHMQPESPVWQIAPGLDFFLHWADVVSHLFSLVIIPH